MTMTQEGDVLTQACQLQAAGQSCVLATVVQVQSPTSGKPGDKALVDTSGHMTGWIGGGCAQPVVVKAARRALAEGKPHLIRIIPEMDRDANESVSSSEIEEYPMRCYSGGTMEIFIEPLMASPGLLVLGRSPVARTLVSLATRVGFVVTAAAKGAGREDYADASEVVSSLRVEDRSIRRPLFVIVATQGEGDELGLETALDLPAEHIAFVASERKANQLRSDLKQRGRNPSKVDAIEAPAGITMDCRRPEEIAVSVLAGLINVRNMMDRRDIPEAMTVSEAIDPVCGMTVNPATTEFATEYEGTTEYFCCEHCQHLFQQDPATYTSGRETT